MSEVKQKMAARAPTQGPPIWLWLIIAGGLLVVIAGVVLTQNGGKPNAAPGAPQLVVDQELIDLGDVPLGQPVTATFTITNTGGSPLRFTEAPWIELMDGC